MTATSTLPALLKILADDVRLGVLGLLAREELAVGELGRVLGVSSSRLGNHLRILREAGLVSDRKEGGWTFVRLNREGSLPADLWEVVEAHLARSPAFRASCERLQDVLEERRARSREYFDRIAPEWDQIGADFETGAARHRVAANLVSQRLVVADVGCGTGYLSAAVSGLVDRVILIDHSAAMLDRARRNLAPFEDRLEFRTGEIDQLPLADGEVDAVVAGMVLHHAPDLTAFFHEARRVLAPGGILVIEDLLPHREGWMREVMADLRLGLDPSDLQARLSELGFTDFHQEVVDDQYRPERPEGGRAELPLFIARARKPAADPRPRSQDS